MRILINAASAHLGGSITYLANLLRYLPVAMPDCEFVVYLPTETYTQFQKTDWAKTVTLKCYPYHSTSGASRLYFDQVIIAQLVRAHKCDLLFSTTGFGTYFSPCPQILLIRNAIYFDRNEQLSKSTRNNTIRLWLSLASIRTADLTLFPTAAMRDLVAEHMSLTHIKTDVIPYGFDHETFFKLSTSSKFIKQIQNWRHDGNIILINVSVYAIHKNFETVIESLPLILQSGVPIKFITTLSREHTGHKAEYDALMQRIHTLGLESTVVCLGNIPHDHLASIYNESDIFIFPSVVESFGHPMVEAMAANLPVVASNTAVNREICGSAGLFFDAFSVESCAQAISMLLTNTECRNTMKNNARERAKDFSWSKYAEKFASLALRLL